MPEIADATAFFQPTVSEIVFMDSVASTTLVPTSAEITAGLKLMNELYDVAGFTGSTNWIPRRKGGSRIDTQLAGKFTFEGSSITFTMDKDGADAAAEFEEEQTGFLLMAYRGLIATRPAEVFQVEVGAVVNLPSFDGSDYPRIRVDFGINRRERIVIPTLS